MIKYKVQSCHKKLINKDQFNGLDTFEHIVVLMLENRSFDNLLGYLYDKNEVPKGKSFEGFNTGEYSNPVPSRAVGYINHTDISPSRATDYSVPFPDPGEEYQHINTQLFNRIIPDSNLGVEQQNMVTPFNLPCPTPKPTMNGFINDYESNLRATYGNGTIPTYDQYKCIMECFQPDQIPVMTGLAKQFAVFDHWFCSVPSQTYCNRAFWHAANSAGKVINPLEEDGSGIHGIIGDLAGMDSWMKDVWPLPTLFDRMTEREISWKIFSPIYPLSLTDIIHNYSLNHPFHTHKYSEFESDIQNGTLPQYYIQPNSICNQQFDHTSFVKTVCQKWNLDPLSDRDNSDKTQPFTSVFSDQIRDWGEFQLAAIPTTDIETNLADDPLNGLQKAILTALLHMEKVKGLGNTSASDIKTIGEMMEFIKRFE